MNTRPNPYAAPRDPNSSSAAELALAAIRTFRGRSIIAILLATAIAGTAILLGWLWLIDAIDLGAFGFVFLASLIFATLALLAAARCYVKGARKTAVALVVFAPLLIISAMLLAMHEAGVI